MKRKIVSTTATVLMIFIASFAINTSALGNCITCDAFPDDGKCDRQDLLKRCKITTGWEGDDCQWFASVDPDGCNQQLAD